MDAPLTWAGSSSHAGALLRHWRRGRHVTLTDLARASGLSIRALRLLECGHTIPDLDVVRILMDRLDIPLRDRNSLLRAAGYPAAFPAGSMSDPAVGATVDLVLAAQEPHPACALDRHWHVSARNAALERLIAGVDPALLRPPVSILRLMLHPAGLAPRIINLGDWRRVMTERARRRFDMTGDILLGEMLEEVRDYPFMAAGRGDEAFPGVAVPLRLVTVDGTLSFISTTTMFAAATDVTLSELEMNTFFPADIATASLMRAAGQGAGP